MSRLTLSLRSTAQKTPFMSEQAAIAKVQPAPTAVPRWLKLAALAWVGAWIPIYLVYYGWTDFLHLSDIAIAITAVGLWTSSRLLLSSQLLSTLLVESIWTVDVVWAALTHHYLIPGVEYLWDRQYPLWLRMMTFYHIVVPLLLLWVIWRMGYDRRALKLQATIGAAALIAGRLWGGPVDNINFAFRDPFFNWSWGPTPLHLLVMFAGMILLDYWPMHWLLTKLFTRPDASIIS